MTYQDEVGVQDRHCAEQSDEDSIRPREKMDLRRARNDVVGVGTSPSTRYQSNQILFGDDFTEPAVVCDEFLNEFMDAVLENIVHVAVFQPVADAAGVALGRALTAIGDADLVEIAHQGAGTTGPQTRQRT